MELDMRDLEDAKCARMRWNTPLSEEHAELLLCRLDVQPGQHVLDLGCGWAELLLRAVASGGTADGVVTTGTGVDCDTSALERGRLLAVDRHLDGRVSLVEREAREWTAPADRVICIGASHAWGTTEDSLEALSKLVVPGGRVLYGDGCWEGAVTKPAHRIFGDNVRPLADVVAAATAVGFSVLHMSTADLREWDDFESTWRAGRYEWLIEHPDDPRAVDVREQLDALLHEYVGGYRGVLGFCYLVLVR
jgi:SAM-dependent methyltransferase